MCCLFISGCRNGLATIKPIALLRGSHYGSIVELFPPKSLTATITKPHILPVHRTVAARANRITMSVSEYKHFCYGERYSVGHCCKHIRITQPFWCLFQGHLAIPPEILRDRYMCKSETEPTPHSLITFQA